MNWTILKYEEESESEQQYMHVKYPLYKDWARRASEIHDEFIENFEDPIGALNRLDNE